MSHPLISELQSRLGEAYVASTTEQMQRYTDEPRLRWRQMPLAVARPGSTAEVAAIVQACRAHRVPIVTRGGGTGTVGGASATTDRAELVLSLDRMRAVRDIQPSAATLTAEAGVALDAARAAAREHDLDIPLWLASDGSATIGGVLATNAGGNTTIRHGNARRMMLGLKAVLADGRVLNLLSGLRKDNSGYALAELLVGSEGTLGILTAATISLIPRPRQRITLMCAIPSPAAALELLEKMRAGLGETLSAFELMPRQALELSLNHLPDARDPLDPPSPWYALVDAETAIPGDWLQPAATGLFHELIEGGTVTDAVAASSEQQADQLWALREAISPAQKAFGASIKHDISIPIAAIPAMIDETL
ncbi:MAG: FAD-binding oxidoreductase, partial [Wenzhouxiangellaceae bacterium]